MKKLALFVFLMLGALSITIAQELNCKVTVTHREIQNVDAKVFKSLEKGLNEFMNNKKWTTDQFQNNEKIECSFLLNLTKKVEENVYQGTLTINAIRPVFGASYTTSIFNFVEQSDGFVFRFEESQTLLFDENRIVGSDALASNLTAIFAYYAYIILGYDYDSFSPLGGTEWFKKANIIVTNAPEESKISGWKSSDKNNTNRYWIVEQLLNPRYENARRAWYEYHRLGLDLLSTKNQEGLEKIMSVLRPLDELNKSFQNPAIVKLFFFAKSLEYQNFLTQVPSEQKKDYVDMLARIDIPNASKYKAVK
jgi:hypothetical protein